MSEHLDQNLTDCSKADLWMPYFEDAEPHLEAQWEKIIWPQISEFDFSTTLELAPGGGRNTAKLLEIAQQLHIVDFNQYCIDACQKRFADYDGSCELHYHVNDGMKLPMISDGSVSAAYSWDSAVHMDRLVVQSYIHEFARILAPGGQAFLHHSNYGTICSRAEIKENPHWRSNMSAALCVEYAAECGLEIARQSMLEWAKGYEGLDCLSILRKPS